MLRLTNKYFYTAIIISLLLVFPTIINVQPIVSGEPSNIYYVAKNGSDYNPGTEALPWKTLTKAGNTATAGDTVYIKQGTYYEQFEIKNSGSSGNYITFSAYQNDDVIIDGTSISLSWDGLIRLDSNAYIKISGLTIQNSKYFGIYCKQSCNNIIIENNNIINCQSSGIIVYPSSTGTPNHFYIYNNTIDTVCMNMNQEALSLSYVDTFEIINNKVFNSYKEGIDVKSGCRNGLIYENEVSNHDAIRPCIYVDAYAKDSYNIHIEKNIVYDNGQGITLGTEQGGTLENIMVCNNLIYTKSNGFSIHGYSTSGSHYKKDIFFINNIIHMKSDGTCVMLTDDDDHFNNLVIRNNILSGTNYHIITTTFNDYSNIHIDHNLITSSSNYYGTSYIRADPKFNDPNNDDFQLRADSPAIDQGNPILAPSHDFNGIVRPQGAQVDIGAYEYTDGSNNQADKPSNIQINADGRFNLELSWMKAEDKTIIEYRTSPGEWSRGSGTLLYDGTGESASLTDLSPGQTVYFMFWAYNIADNVYSDGVYASGTTAVNQAPVYSNVVPSDGETGLGTSLTWQVDISDPDGDSIKWWIYCDEYSNSGTAESSETIQIQLSGLSYNTEYQPRIYLNDDYTSVEKEFSFKTKTQVQYTIPTNIQVNMDNRYQLDLTWMKAEDKTIIEYRTSPGEWSRGSGTLLYDGTGESASLTDLSPGQTVYFMFWAYNIADNVYSDGVYASGTTAVNQAPVYSNVVPSDGETGLGTSLTWQVDISDPDGDNIRWWILCDGDVESGESSSSDTIGIQLTNLNYNTEYTTRIYLYDEFEWVSKTFTFKTKQQTNNGAPTNIEINADGRFKLDLSWTKADDKTIIEFRTSKGEWTRGSGIPLYDGYGETTSLDELSPGQPVYFMFWAYDTEKDTYSEGVYASGTTDENKEPLFTNEIPENGEKNQETTLTWQVDISDPDGDSVKWWIVCNGQVKSGEATSYETIEIYLTNLKHNSFYYPRVYLNDGFEWVVKDFSFKTERA